MAQPLGVLDILVNGQAAGDRLPQPIGQPELCVVPTTGVDPEWFDEFADSQSLVQFAQQDQPPWEASRDPWKSIFKEVLKES